MRDFFEDDNFFGYFIVEFVAVSLGDGGVGWSGWMGSGVRGKTHLGGGWGGVEWVDG